jgi:hypothetical protein
MRHLQRLFTVTALLLGLFAAAAQATTIQIVNTVDGPTEGFNDPTPVAPIGGNPGTTLGQQRLNAFQYAADLWAAILPSNITIRVAAKFDPQTCSATSGVLGSAGPVSVHRDFAGALAPATWFHVALANKLANTDLSAGDDITSTFNSDVDNSTCLGTTDWYYGFDGNEGTDIDLVSVVLHELGHGLGFSTQVTLSTGALFMTFKDRYMTFLFDNTVGLNWANMTNTQRRNSAINPGNVAWVGSTAIAAAPMILGAKPVLRVNSPGSIAGDKTIGLAAFGPDIATVNVTGNLVLVNDSVDPTADACEPIQNSVSGKIALIERGTCTFVSKVLAAQTANAIGVVIYNNVPGAPVTMGGSDPTITIPAVMVSDLDGAAMVAELMAFNTVNVSITTDPNQLAGTDPSKRPLIYTPNPLVSGSSVSHWDTSHFPNTLMEPAINSDITQTTDLTRYMFQDIGWFQGATDVTHSPSVTKLYPATPNPFNPNTAIKFEVATAGKMKLEVFDVQGRLRSVLYQGDIEAGQHVMVWNGRGVDGDVLPTGVYIARLEAAGEKHSQRLVLLK